MTRYRRQRGDEHGDGSAHRRAAADTGNLAHGTGATKADWLIVSPTGRKWRAHGLQQWCRDNVGLFPGLKWEQVRSGLASVNRGQTKSWHGWICQRMGP